MLPPQLSIFKINTTHVPGIFGSHRLRGASKHGLILPRGHPALEPLKGGDSPKPVAHRKDGESSVALGIEVVLPFAEKGCSGNIRTSGPGHPALELLEEESEPIQGLIGKK